MSDLPSPPITTLLQPKCLWIFADYDGTLAEFVPNPDVIVPRSEVVELVKRLVANPQIRMAIVSGRRLSHTHALLPIQGLILAGTYGVELETPDGEIHHPDEYKNLRPALDEIKKHWEGAITGKNGFYLEDKGYAIALHARYATEADSRSVLTSARQWAEGNGKPATLKILGGNRFLEVAPLNADKGNTVRHILGSRPLSGVLSLYLGDDDKDESGFEAVTEAGGMSILVAEKPRATHARYRLDSPRQVRRWLADLDEKLRVQVTEMTTPCGR